MSKEEDVKLDTKLLSEIIVYMKYAKYLPKLNRRETWDELVTRNMDMHIKKYPFLKDEIVESYKLVYEKKILPSMRALGDSTPIITKSGWKIAGNIVSGDILYDSKGKETKVIDTIKFTDKDLYVIKFSDKSKITCCDEHLWIIATNDDLKFNNTRVVSTKFIREHLMQGNRHNITIFNPLPIIREEQQLYIDPYILGLWLGDGYSNGTQYSSHIDDSKFLMKQFAKAGYNSKHSMSSNVWTWNIYGLKEDLKRYNLVRNKHIPQEYILGSIQQRLDLVSGLMDSDGCIDKSGRYEFSNTNEIIIEGFKELLSSLGIKYITSSVIKNERSQELFNVLFFTDLQVCKLPRKVSRMKPRCNPRTNLRKVFSVDYAGKGSATCFHVDSLDHSFLAGKEMIITHNSMQFAGKSIEISPSRIYNCAFAPINDYRIFAEIMFLLLGGTGIGYSVQKHHIEELPEIRKPILGKTRRFLIGDSIEGWSDSISVLMKAYFNGGSKPIFDFRDIRAKGMRLVTSGGKAPGPQPLKECLLRIEGILESKKDGDKLTPLETHDIVCYIADAVLAGGIRRAALICLFSATDTEMIGCKTGDWWEKNPQRGRANNSAVLMRHKITKEYFLNLWKRIEISGSGEPGIYFSNDKDFGCNPCNEVSLRAFQFCNLCEVNAGDVKNQDDLNERVKTAAFIGTIQASYTDFHYLRPIWKRTTEKEALIGVSLTGISSGSVLNLDMSQAAKIVVSENRRIADIIGINPAARTTVVKPAGTTSLVLGTSSGIHAWHNDYYVRRMRVSKNEAIYTYLSIYHPNLIEDEYFRPHDTAVISIPQKAPMGAILRNETAIELLERIRKVHKEWIKPGHISGSNTHNVSATISIKPDEWDTVGEWMWDNRNSYNGLSVLPYSEHTYIQAPFEDCTKDRYEELLLSLTDLDLRKVVELDDNTNLTGELACSGGSCTITQL